MSNTSSMKNEYNTNEKLQDKLDIIAYLEKEVYPKMIIAGIEEEDIPYIKLYKDDLYEEMWWHAANLINPENNPYDHREYGKRIKNGEISNEEYMEHLKATKGLINALNKYIIQDKKVVYHGVIDAKVADYLITSKSEMLDKGGKCIYYIPNAPLSTTLLSNVAYGYMEENNHKTNVCLKITTSPGQRGIMFNDILHEHEILLHPLTEIEITNMYMEGEIRIFEGGGIDYGVYL